LYFFSCEFLQHLLAIGPNYLDTQRWQRDITDDKRMLVLPWNESSGALFVVVPHEERILVLRAGGAQSDHG